MWNARVTKMTSQKLCSPCCRVLHVIGRIDQCPLANAVRRVDFRAKQPQFDFLNTYPLDGDLSAMLRYPTFEQLEPVLLGHASRTCIKKTNNNTKNASNAKAGIQRQTHVSVVSYTSFCSSNQLHRGRRKYYCIKIFCNQFIQIKVYCAHNVSLENVQHYCIANKYYYERESYFTRRGIIDYIVSYLMWIIIWDLRPLTFWSCKSQSPARKIPFFFVQCSETSNTSTCISMMYSVTVLPN